MLVYDLWPYKQINKQLTNCDNESPPPKRFKIHLKNVIVQSLRKGFVGMIKCLYA